MPPTPPPHDDADTAATRAKLRRQLRRSLWMVLACVVFLVSFPATVWAAGDTGGTNSFLQVALFLGGLSLLPFAVMTLTSFLRIVVVLSFLRSGLGAQNVPPNMVIIALSLFLSLFVMGPTLDTINKQALQPVQKGKMTQSEGFEVAGTALKSFMVKQIGANSRKEVDTFYSLAKNQGGTKVCKADQTPTDDDCLANAEQIERDGAAALPLRVVIPAFIVSELKKAFIMGFAVLLPFLVIDMVISNILLSLGMFMLPPVVISLPFKILLFVLAGGWTMVIEFLVKGFNY